jgi:hypothetical protein
VSDVVIPLAALGISVVTFAFGVFTMRRAADAGSVHRLEKRVGELEKELDVCERRRLELEDENLRLMRRLIAGNHGTG